MGVLLLHAVMTLSNEGHIKTIFNFYEKNTLNKENNTKAYN